jgi:hypothetical protein
LQVSLLTKPGQLAHSFRTKSSLRSPGPTYGRSRFNSEFCLFWKIRQTSADRCPLPQGLSGAHSAQKTTFNQGCHRLLKRTHKHECD